MPPRLWSESRSSQYSSWSSPLSSCSSASSCSAAAHPSSSPSCASGRCGSCSVRPARHRRHAAGTLLAATSPAAASMARALQRVGRCGAAVNTGWSGSPRFHNRWEVGYYAGGNGGGLGGCIMGCGAAGRTMIVYGGSCGQIAAEQQQTAIRYGVATSDVPVGHYVGPRRKKE